jgi:hypothetical protein
MTRFPTAKKFLGAVVAAMALTMVTSIAPAQADAKADSKGNPTVLKRDTGWD